MDGNYLHFPSDGGYAYDQSLDFISEDFDHDEHRQSLSSINTLGSGDTAHMQETQVRKPPRPQRQKSSTSEQTKHRRTRSGCYTCRQRRVKCDESRPICERCRKGKRDCAYPDKTTVSTKSSRSTQKSKSKSPGTGSSSSSDEQDPEQYSLTTPDESESRSNASSRPTKADSKRSTILEEYKGAIAELQSPVEASLKRSSALSLEQSADWETYPRDIKFYLEYFCEHITYCHYAFKHDPRDFLKTSYLQAALDFQPLLYSLVAFAAYHHALRHPESRPERFLDYYDQSVSLFRQALARGNNSPTAVLLTMLQLATIEEFLGDWMSLLNHQRAAAQLMQGTFAPHDMTQTFTHRVILVWYWRFDLFAGVLSGNTLTLGREWFAACVDFCAKAATRDTTEDLAVLFDHFFTKSRLLVTDVTLLFAAKSAGTIENRLFEESVVKLWTRLQDHAQRVENAFRDVPYFNNTWSEDAADNALTDYTDPHFLFTGPYFTMNYILVDSWAGRIIFLQKLRTLRHQGIYTPAEPSSDPALVFELIMKKCKMLEAMQHSEVCPSGAVLGLQASLGMVPLFLPHDKKYTDWARRKLALIEANGYIYPSSYRKGMSDLWNLDVSYWWLPDGEGLTPLIRSMRHFIDYRATSSRPPDDRDVEVRDMNGIFNRMRLTMGPVQALAMTNAW